MTTDMTQLLRDFSEGDASALNALAPMVYRELRKMALRQFSRERSGHTLQPTAVVHEVFLKLFRAKSIHIQSKEHFFAVAAQMMRRILINHAESRTRLKRGGGAVALNLDEARHASEIDCDEVLALDEALKKLAKRHERQARVVELKYFAGLNVEQIAGVLDCSPATVKRDWLFSRAWLFNEMRNGK